MLLLWRKMEQIYDLLRIYTTFLLTPIYLLSEAAFDLTIREKRFTKIIRNDNPGNRQETYSPPRRNYYYRR